jgi:hypothetical protein
LIGTAGSPRRLAPWQAIGAVFVLLAVVRVGMVLALAPAFAFVEEWYAVVMDMGKPLRHGQFEPFYLLASHNGHPLLWTKLVSLLFLRAGDLQFDNVPVCVFNQIVYALGSAILAWSAATRLGPERGWFLFVAMLVIALPFDWENITMGWGNPYAMLSFFSVGLIVACACARASLAGMLAVAVLGGAATFSMGPGLVAPVIGAGMLLWRMRLGELSTLCAAGMSVILIGWAAIGFAVGRTTQVTGQDAAWSLIQAAQIALLLLCWLPTWVHLRRYAGGERSRFDLVILCVAIWAFVQIAAMVLERPRYFRLWLPISRYMDIIPVGIFAVLASVCRLAASRAGLPFGLPPVTARRVLVVAAICVTLASPLAFYWQLRWAGLHHQQAQVLRTYLETRDPRILADAPDSSLAYPSRERLKKMLDDPDTQSIIGRALFRTD